MEERNMAIDLDKTLAEALVERKALKDQLEDLQERLEHNVHVQEGDKPAENPETLLAQLDTALADLERLIVAINRTNLATQLPGPEGWSLMEAIARRDMLTLRQSILQQVIEISRVNHWVVTRSEVRSITVLDVAATQKEIDTLAKERRELDVRLQAANWTVRLTM